MTRYKVVGREERLVITPKQDGTQEEVLQAELIVRAVNDDGSPLGNQPTMLGVPGMSPGDSRIRVESLDSPDAYPLGTLTRLASAADPVVSP